MLWKCLFVVCALSVTTIADHLGFSPCPGLTSSVTLPDTISSTQCTLKNMSSTSSNNICKLFFPSVFDIQLVLDVPQFINFSAVVTTKNVVTMSDSPVALNNVITCNDLTASTDIDDDAENFYEVCSLQIDTSPLFTGSRGFCFSFISQRLSFKLLDNKLIIPIAVTLFDSSSSAVFCSNFETGDQVFYNKKPKKMPALR